MTDAPEIVRTLEIRAPRETVFRYFTDPVRWAAWWGDGSTVEPRPGGAVLIRYPNGATASGSVREIAPPERFVFTFGNENPSGPIPPGGSTVTILLEESGRGTRLTLRHSGLPSAEIAGQFVQGWRYQLSVFSKVVTAEAHAGAAATADRWFAAWNEADEARRREALAACSADDVSFCDAYGVLSGRDDVGAQIAAARVYMPGMTLRRSGEPLLSHGHALVRWEAVDAAGALKGSGTNVFTFGTDGKIERVVGFWGA